MTQTCKGMGSGSERKMRYAPSSRPICMPCVFLPLALFGLMTDIPPMMMQEGGEEGRGEGGGDGGSQALCLLLLSAQYRLAVPRVIEACGQRAVIRGRGEREEQGRKEGTRVVERAAFVTVCVMSLVCVM